MSLHRLFSYKSVFVKFHVLFVAGAVPVLHVSLDKTVSAVVLISSLFFSSFYKVIFSSLTEFRGLDCGVEFSESDIYV